MNNLFVDENNEKVKLTDEDLFKFGGFAKFIEKLLDYYTINANDFENKYYMEIEPPKKLENGLTIPGYVVELHRKVGKLLRQKKQSERTEKYIKLHERK